mmetsp:Transcript_10273/g.29021  ORF Transcript_10273/g.29021 Transcript_10273/m.29021 type:complete len:323 (-) Transcript_10273:876-1844(-)
MCQRSAARCWTTPAQPLLLLLLRPWTNSAVASLCSTTSTPSRTPPSGQKEPLSAATLACRFAASSLARSAPEARPRAPRPWERARRSVQATSSSAVQGKGIRRYRATHASARKRPWSAARRTPTARVDRPAVRVAKVAASRCSKVVALASESVGKVVVSVNCKSASKKKSLARSALARSQWLGAPKNASSVPGLERFGGGGGGSLLGWCIPSSASNPWFRQRSMCVLSARLSLVCSFTPQIGQLVLDKSACGSSVPLRSRATLARLSSHVAEPPRPPLASLPAPSAQASLRLVEARGSSGSVRASGGAVATELVFAEAEEGA